MKKRTAAVLSLLTAGTLLTGGCAAKRGLSVLPASAATAVISRVFR